MSECNDLGLTIPMEGIQLIEASAGTGKTFVLTTLYTRLVIEQRLTVPEILSVTFTKNAVKELRNRIRQRLTLALNLALGKSIESSDSDYVSTATLVSSALECENRSALLQRLRAAIEAMYFAPIYTIHSFCQHILSDYPLEAGSAFDVREELADEGKLYEEVATEFWRLASCDASDSRVLYSIWKSGPLALAKSLRELSTVDVLLPAPTGNKNLIGLEDLLISARKNMFLSFGAYGIEAKNQIDNAIAADVMNRQRFRKLNIDSVWQCLTHWSASDGLGDPEDKNVSLLSSRQLNSFAKKGKQAPQSELFDAIQIWDDAREAVKGATQEHAIELIHKARRYANERISALKRERGLMSYDDMIHGVANALDAVDSEELVKCLRNQYRAALVDEFQDTDPRQWHIFRKLFGTNEHPLFLIGDPKQAIYRFRGGDVFAYLAAAENADVRHGLQRNFRSRPLLLSSIQELFEYSGDGVFVQDGIEFTPVEACDTVSDDAFCIDGASAPAVNFVNFSADLNENIETSRERATIACVASIYELLKASADNRAVLTPKRGECRAIQPSDIAVLVERNDDAARIQYALTAANIPCITVARSAIFKTEEALHVYWLFEALVTPGDESMLRAALATPLFGFEAFDISCLNVNELMVRVWQNKFQGWRLRAVRHGPVALLNEICAENSTRLLTLEDGEYRLGNYLQLAEILQSSYMPSLGLMGLRDELERRISNSDDSNEEEFLRLDPGADGVKILTVHKSKGLEFEFVFLPYAATSGGGYSNNGAIKMAKHHQGKNRVAVLYPEKDSTAEKLEHLEEHAEKIRLLYVALTRARLAVWVIWGVAKQIEKTSLAWLLHRQPGKDTLGKIDHATMALRMADLVSKMPKAIAITNASPIYPQGQLLFASAECVPMALSAKRSLIDDWRVHSFSQWVREDAHSASYSANAELDKSGQASSRFSGARFGNSLHTALERVAMSSWFGWSEKLPPSADQSILVESLRGQGYVSDVDLIEGVPLLTDLVARTLNVVLPEGVCLAQLPASSRRSEMEFHFSLTTESVAFLEILHSYGIAVDRKSIGSYRQLEGLVNGFIDLVYEVNGRYYVIDYKSNYLPNYETNELAKAIRENEYDLQYVLYSLALHRWLRFRFGTAYEPKYHFGGVRYLFCRGLELGIKSSPGIYVPVVPLSLLESLDKLFGLKNSIATELSSVDSE